MRTLVLFSAFSNSLLSLCYDTLDSGPTVVVDFDDEIHSKLKSFGISSIPIRVPGDSSWAKRDTEFANLAMPGSLDFNFKGTSLSAWKVLSLDRFSFWYRGRQAQLQYEAIMGLDWERGLVPLSLHHPVPWRIARERQVMAVQVEALRTRAWRDWLSKPLPFTKLFLWSQRDIDFLKNFAGEMYICEAGDFPAGVPVDKNERLEARKMLGISEFATVALVIFDSQTEWEFRSTLPEIVQAYNHVLIFPLQPHDRRNLSDLGVFGGNIRIIESMSFEAAADEVITFRYEESLIRPRRVPIRVVDLKQRWDSNLLNG